MTVNFRVGVSPILALAQLEMDLDTVPEIENTLDLKQALSYRLQMKLLGRRQ